MVETAEQKSRTRAEEEGTAGTFITSPYLTLPWRLARAGARAAPMHHARNVVWGNKLGVPPGGCGALETRVTAKRGNGNALTSSLLRSAKQRATRERKKAPILGKTARLWGAMLAVGQIQARGPLLGDSVQ